MPRGRRVWQALQIAWDILLARAFARCGVEYKQARAVRVLANVLHTHMERDGNTLQSHARVVGAFVVAVCARLRVPCAALLTWHANTSVADVAATPV
jgi:hypothetical protein